MSGKGYPKRGEIYWVDLDPAVGSETQKTRPGLIVSNNMGNEASSIVMIAPITSKVKNVYPFEVKTTLEGKSVKIMLNQCKALDKSRVRNKISTIDANTMREIEEAIRIVFGLM